MGQDLITGGSGFIGSHMCGLLVVHNYQERVLDSSQWGIDPKGRPAYINTSSCGPSQLMWMLPMWSP